MQPTPRPPETPVDPQNPPAPAAGSPMVSSTSQFPFRPTEPPPEPEPNPVSPTPEPSSTPRVLVVHPDSSTLRIVRESLTSFRHCQVETTPDAEYGFELALKRRYQLFVFGLTIPVLPGEILYSLISRAYTFSHAGALTAPAIIYIGDAKDASRAAELKQDARVKGLVFRPFKIERFLNALGDALPENPSKVI